MRKLGLLALLMLAACNSFTHPDTQQSGTSHEKWALYYDKTLPASTFAECNLVVFDRNRHPDFKKLQRHHTTVLAYVSIGEVNNDVPEKKILEEGNALIIKEKTVWNSYPIDISRPEWKDYVMVQVADAQHKGFDGVMLDTVDTPMDRLADAKASDLEWAQAQEVKLIHEIHEQYPDMKIMMNRGFDILPRVASVIDYELAESTLVDADVSTGQFRLFPPKTYQISVNQLEAGRLAAPGLKIYTLDYWNQNDVEGLHKIYAIQRAQGFAPYVSTPDLRRFTPEPVELIRESGASLMGDLDA